MKGKSHLIIVAGLLCLTPYLLEALARRSGTEITYPESNRYTHEQRVQYERDLKRNKRGPFGNLKGPKVTLVGDSIAFGYGLNAGDSLAAALAKRLPAYRWSALGFPGANLEDEMPLMESAASEGACAVLWVGSFNDPLLDVRELPKFGLTLPMQQMEWLSWNGPSEPPAWWFSHYLRRKGREITLNRLHHQLSFAIHRFYSSNYPGVAKAKSALSHFSTLTRESGAAPGVIWVPLPRGWVTTKASRESTLFFRDAAKERNLPFWDLTYLWPTGIPEQDRLAWYDTHPGAKGYQSAAHWLAPKLAPVLKKTCR